MTLQRVGIWSAAKLSGVLYAAMGLAGGAAAAAGYNVIAGWIGGLEFELIERP